MWQAGGKGSGNSGAMDRRSKRPAHGNAAARTAARARCGPEASKAMGSCGKDAVMAQGLQQSSKARRAAASEASDKGGGGNGGGGDEGERAAASAVAMATMEVRPKVPRWSGKEQRRETEAAREGAASGSEDGWSGLGAPPTKNLEKLNL